MKKTKENWLFAALLTIVMIVLSFGFWDTYLNNMTAYAATVGNNAEDVYSSGGVRNYLKSVGTKQTSAGSETVSSTGITYSWSGASGSTF